MGSLPKLDSVDPDDESTVRRFVGEDAATNETQKRELSFEERVDVAFAVMDAGPTGPNRIPTRQSLEAVKLAAEETRIAKRAVATHDEKSEIPSLATDTAPLWELDEAFASPQEPAPMDPFGGLIPVEDEQADAEAEPEEGARLVALTSLIPRMLVGANEIAALPVDPRAAFILDHIDGVQSMEEIIDICPMPEAEALELLETLRRLGVISLG